MIPNVQTSKLEDNGSRPYDPAERKIVEISEMKDEGRYKIPIAANGSVWKKIERAANKRNQSVNKFLIDCARTGWKSVEAESGNSSVECLFDSYPGLSEYIVVHRDSISTSGVEKFLGVRPPVALSIVNTLMKNGFLRKGARPSSWEFVDDREMRAFAKEWICVDDEIRAYATKLIRNAGSFRPAEAISCWCKSIREDLVLSEAYEDFMSERKLFSDTDFDEYIREEVTKISKVLDDVSRKKKSGGMDVDPEVLQEMYDRDVLASGWDDLL